MYLAVSLSVEKCSPRVFKSMIAAGANVLRYNFAYGHPTEILSNIKRDRALVSKMCLSSKPLVLADLPGAKIRLAKFKKIKKYDISIGDRVVFCGSDIELTKIKNAIPVQVSKLSLLININQIITLGDGELAFRVIKILNESSFIAIALNSGITYPFKAINVGYGIDKMNHQEVMVRFVEHLSVVKPDWIALSFVSSAKFVREFRRLLEKYSKNWHPLLVSKIESPMGIENLEEIIKESDIVMVARGDLGLNCPIECLGIYQKKIVNLARTYKKKSIVATQILNSTLNYFIPTRSDILDLTNIIIDGADGIMLVDEVIQSKEPKRVISFATNLIDYINKKNKSEYE